MDALTAEPFLFTVGEIIVRMGLYGICISPLVNLGHAERESFQNKLFSCTHGEIPSLLATGHCFITYIKSIRLLRPNYRVEVFLGQLCLGHVKRISDCSGGISLSQGAGRGDPSSTGSALQGRGLCSSWEESASSCLLSLKLHSELLLLNSLPRTWF